MHISEAIESYISVNDEPSYYLHLATNFEEIYKARKLLCSAGCLTGAVYVTPLKFDSKTNSFRMHNLAAYYYLSEMPKRLENYKKKEITPLIIEICKAQHSIIDYNYLKLGRVHYQTYQSSLNGMSLAGDRLQVISNLEKLLQIGLCEPISFYETFLTCIDNFPFFGYFLFEALTSYIICYQNDSYSSYVKDVYFEDNNWNYKNIIYEIKPDLLKNYNLKGFSFTLYYCYNLLHRYFDAGSFEVFCRGFTNILRRLLIDNLFSKENNKFDIRSILGHDLHRNNTRREMNLSKAKELWQTARKINAPVSRYCIYNRGEYGILPTINDFDYRVYTSNDLIVKNRDVFLNIDERIDLHVSFDLVEKSFMRR
jgi:hypothetical protein